MSDAGRTKDAAKKISATAKTTKLPRRKETTHKAAAKVEKTKDKQ
jgi:hypothetical protein